MIERLRLVLGVTTACSLFSMMALTFLDVVGRKFFDQSITGSLEISELLMLVVIFTGLPMVTLAERHVMFDLLDSRLPESLRALIHRSANVFCALLMAGAAWLVSGRAQRAAEYQDTTANLHISMHYFYWLTALLLVATAVAHVYLALRGPVEIDDDAGVGA